MLSHALGRPRGAESQRDAGLGERGDVDPLVPDALVLDHLELPGLLDPLGGESRVGDEDRVGLGQLLPNLVRPPGVEEEQPESRRRLLAHHLVEVLSGAIQVEDDPVHAVFHRLSRAGSQGGSVR